jgi:hypothetical protein
MKKQTQKKGGLKNYNGQQIQQQSNWQSQSAWNYSWSPGWTKENKNVLSNALMKFGVGRWKKLEQ